MPDTVPATIAVIIPTCDRPSLLAQAIASVLAQDLAPAEILVIDNGRQAAPESHSAAGVRYFRLKPRVGPSRARNFGAAMATSRFVAFLDDDDLWAPSFLREALGALRAQQAKCVFGRRDLVTDGGSARYKMASRDSLTIDTLLRRNPGTAPSNLMLERELFFRIGGFDEGLFISEDRAIAIELLLHGDTIAFAPDAVALIRTHDLGHLSMRHARKFRFLWKYRRLHSAGSFLAEAVRIVAKLIAAPILGRATSMMGRSASRP